MRTCALVLLHVCVLALAACGNEASTFDAGPPCMETAEPHDEDGDGVYDACDNCPAMINPDQSDTTEKDLHGFPDGVGDACDLRPGTGGDTVARFYTFAVDTQAGEWSGDGFAIANDTVHTDASAQWSRIRLTTGDGLAVFAQFTSVTLNEDAEFTIVLDGSDLGGGNSCVLAPDVLSARESSGAVMTKPIAPTILPDQPFTLIAWRIITLVEGVRVARVTCRLIRDGSTTDTTLTLADDLVSGHVALSSTNVAATISSLTVYTSPGPKNP